MSRVYTSHLRPPHSGSSERRAERLVYVTSCARRPTRQQSRSWVHCLRTSAPERLGRAAVRAWSSAKRCLCQGAVLAPAVEHGLIDATWQRVNMPRQLVLYCAGMSQGQSLILASRDARSAETTLVRRHPCRSLLFRTVGECDLHRAKVVTALRALWLASVKRKVLASGTYLRTTVRAGRTC